MDDNALRLQALDRAIEKERDKIAGAVGSWACDTVSKRTRAPIIQHSVRDDVAAWLPGLNAAEILALATASAFVVRSHLFGHDDERMISVRQVQPLGECQLIWPKPRLSEIIGDGIPAGGGLRIKRVS